MNTDTRPVLDGVLWLLAILCIIIGFRFGYYVGEWNERRKRKERERISKK